MRPLPTILGGSRANRQLSAHAVRRATHRLLNSDPHRKLVPEVVPNPVLGSWCHNSDILPKRALVHSFFSSGGGLRFLRMDSPRISMRWALWTRRSRMPSAMVGSPICSCQRDRELGSKDGGTGLVAIFADLPDFAALVFIQRRHGPVIDHQNINAA